MGIDWPDMVYEFCFDMYARPLVVSPVVSAPGSGAYTQRCIYHSDGVEFPSEGGALISDQKTYIDIIAQEFPALPAQGDQVWIPLDEEGPDLGNFEITDIWDNGGGEVSLPLKQILPANPVPPLNVTPVIELFPKRKSATPNPAHEKFLKDQAKKRRWPRV